MCEIKKELSHIAFQRCSSVLLSRNHYMYCIMLLNIIYLGNFVLRCVFSVGYIHLHKHFEQQCGLSSENSHLLYQQANAKDMQLCTDGSHASRGGLWTEKFHASSCSYHTTGPEPPKLEWSGVLAIISGPPRTYTCTMI